MLNLSEVLIFPQNKIQLETKVMSVDSECASHMHSIQVCSCQGSATKRKHLGNLSVWFRLTCEMEVLKEHAEHLWMDGRPRSLGSCSAKSTRKKVKIRRKSEELLMSDQATEQSSVDVDERDVRFCDATDSDVIVPKERKSSGRNRGSPKALQSNEIAITIENLVLLNDGGIMDDSSIRKLFVEYNFFGSNTSPSIDKASITIKSSSSSSTTFPIGYRKVFRAKNSSHDQRCQQRFVRLLRNHEKNIRFIVASESKKEDRHNRSDSKDCLELALGLLHLGKVVAEADAKSDKEIVRISIMSKNQPYKNVGFLEVSVEGVELMKKMAIEDG